MTAEREAMAAALPRHRIGDELGRGAWGVVWSAYHETLGRHVAVKALPAHLVADGDVRRRFRSEAQLIASLNNRHVVQVFDFVEHDDLCVLVMERLDGGTLADRSVQRGVSWPEACGAVLAASVALDHAHERGVLHRDIKPQNLLYDGEGALKVTDFGIAKVLGGSSTTATAAGHVLGTPAYIAPEQVLGEELSPATDVYALGTVLYELLSGRLPYTSDGGPLVLLHAHAYEDPTPLLDVAPEVPEALAEVTMRALCRDRTRRYQSAEEFGAHLAEATNRVWDAGWVGRHHLVVVPSGHIARNLSLPPKLRDPAAGAAETVTSPVDRDAPGEQATPEPALVVEVPTEETEPPPPALDTTAGFAPPVPSFPSTAPTAATPPAPGWWLASDGNWYPPQMTPGYRHLLPPAKSKVAAGLLGIFLGALGIHRFYLGYKGQGWTMLLLTVLSFFILAPFIAIWGLVEGIIILAGGIRSRDGRKLE